MGRKVSQTETTWEARMSRFRRGTLTVTEFCQREGVSTPSFYAWRKRLGASGPSARSGKRSGKRPRDDSAFKPTARMFVPVNVTPSPVAEIDFPNGARVRVAATDIEVIRVAVLAAGETSGEKLPC